MKKLLSTAACVLLCSACSDDEAGPVRPHTDYQRITLTEVITPIDAQTVSWSQEFRFAKGQVTGSSTSQSFGTDEEQFTITLNETVTATENEVVITDEEGTSTTYLLNDYGLATEAIRREAGGDTRFYRFSYTLSGSLHQLQAIEEYLADTLFAQLTFDELPASTSDQWQLTQQVGQYRQTFVLTLTTPLQAASSTSPVPPLFVSELHPLTLHTTALYGKLLGEAWPWVSHAASTAGNSGRRAYSYTFTPEGQLSTCTQSSPEHRTISYKFER
ncbi:MAG: DUF4595 domain-containing protein [Bacteroides sp.]